MEPALKQKFKLGVFTLTGFLVFLAAIYFVGQKQNMFGNTERIFANFNNVNGLQTGNSIRYSGIDIGTVESIRMTNDTTIRVNMVVDAKMLPHLKTSAIAIIGSDGLVGSMIVNIFPGTGNGTPIKPGGEITTYSRIRTEDLLRTLSVTNENAALLTVDLLKITKAATEGKGSMGLLLNDTGMADNLKKTVFNLNIASASAANSLKALEHATEGIDNEQNVLGVVKDTLTAGRIKRLVQNLEVASAATDTTLRQVNALIRNAKNGDGPLNYLFNDKDAVKKIDSLLTKLNEAGNLLNEDLKAVRQNVFLRGYFKKKEKEKKTH